jgi:hypothetical protein
MREGVTNITIENFGFHTLPREAVSRILKDGRVFSHFIEHQLAQDFGLTHVPGCKSHDLIDPKNPEIKYEQKTFTSKGCKIMPSSMIGKGRKFDKTIFAEKAEKLTYIIVSNIDFPNIKIKFMPGSKMATLYPNGSIPRGHHDRFFSN